MPYPSGACAAGPARSIPLAGPNPTTMEDDVTLRPQALAEFIGQADITANLGVFISAARSRQESLDHVLFSGMPGLGKTTLAGIIAADMGAKLHVTSGPALEKPGPLVAMLTSLESGDVLFIDEIHALKRDVEELLYSAMEDRRVDITIGDGSAARVISVTLKPFTLVGATTREGKLSEPFRARFGITERLEPYPASELALIVERTAGILGIGVDAAARDSIAQRGRGTPRIVNRLVRRLRDYAHSMQRDRIDLEVAEFGFKQLGIDAGGLNEVDRKILRVLDRHFGPVGLKTIAAAVGEEQGTIEDSYEPHLLRQGLIIKSGRGRLITRKGREALK